MNDLFNWEDIKNVKQQYTRLYYFTCSYTPDTEVANDSSNCDAYYDEKYSSKHCVQHNCNKNIHNNLPMKSARILCTAIFKFLLFEIYIHTKIENFTLEHH